MRPPQYFVIEGPPGVGKTRLTQHLAEHLHATALLDPVVENTFLPRFYTDPARYALPTQLDFLLKRLRVFEHIGKPDLFHGKVISDVLPERDALYAKLMLAADEYAIYDAMRARLTHAVPQPDLVIYLQASADWLLDHSAHPYRHLPQLTEGQVRETADAYTAFFHQYQAAPLLIVNIEHLDLTQAHDIALLQQRIHAMRGMREFFNKGD